jgi:hypothetical protein
MEDMRDRVLAKLASGVADERHAQAESRATEKGYLQAAHRRMKTLKRMTFKAEGVEFIRVPGDEKLRVRLTSGGGEESDDQDVQDVETTDAENQADADAADEALDDVDDQDDDADTIAEA